MNHVAPASQAGIYRYDTVDKDFLAARVEAFRHQVTRRLAGELTEDEFKPLRLLNGLYLQLHGYMLRCAIPYGIMSSQQLRRFARIARVYDRGYGHFTTRQNLQFNWIRLVDAPDILDELADDNLHAIQTSGNCIRNVTTDQFAGAAADEVIDPRVYAEILRQWSTDHPEFAFLPRKFKIAITGSTHDRTAARLHDIGVLAKRNENGEPGFEIFAGGGLGRTPIVGMRLRDFLPEPDFIAYVEAILRVYNALGRRDNIYKARIKILVQETGADAFTKLVEEEFARLPRALYRLDPALVDAILARFGSPDFATLPDASPTLDSARATHPEFARWLKTNTNPHRIPGYISATISLKPIGGIPGDATAEQMDAVADLADRYSFGEIRVAHEQNLVLAHVRKDDLAQLWRELGPLGLATPNTGLVTDIIACPGLDYCDLASARSIPIAQSISARFADLERQHHIGELHLNISGCINACAHHHVGHIGILGVDKRGAEAYQITIGGAADEQAAIGTIIGASVPAEQVPDVIEALVAIYLKHRHPNERFIDAVRRLGPTQFKEAVHAADR